MEVSEYVVDRDILEEAFYTELELVSLVDEADEGNTPLAGAESELETCRRRRQEGDQLQVVHSSDH